MVSLAFFCLRFRGRGGMVWGVMNRWLFLFFCVFPLAFAAVIEPGTECRPKARDTPAFKSRKECREYMQVECRVEKRIIKEEACALSLCPGNRVKVESVKNGIAKVRFEATGVHYIPADCLEPMPVFPPPPEDVQPEGRKAVWLSAERATTLRNVPMFALPIPGEKYERMRKNNETRALRFLGVVIELGQMRYSEPGARLVVRSQIREMVEVETPTGERWWIAAKYLRLAK